MQKVIIQLLDDLDGTVIEEGAGATVKFAFQGKAYEIDLSQGNEDALRTMLAPYIKAGHRVSAAKSKTPATKAESAELQSIRDWASERGLHNSGRGRISASVRAAYKKDQAAA